MGCNCATKEQIEEIYKKYGDKKTMYNKSTKDKIKYYIKQTATVICMIPISIGLFLFVIYKAFCDDDKRISVNKFFRLTEQNIGVNVK